jgi:hypothetical protein
VSTSKSPFELKSVHVDISAEDGASELFLVNGAYNLVGQAIGSLSVDVPPGQYHIRQRIGDTESIRQFDVQEAGGPQTLSLDPLSFPSPAPIFGNPNFQKVSPDDWVKPEQLIGKPGIRLAMRVPELAVSEPLAHAMLARLNSEKARLSLETLDGGVVCRFEERDGTTNPAESGLYLLDLEAAPGHYVLVQSQDGGGRRCLPLVVHQDWSPRVYLLCLQDRDANDPDAFVPVNLDNASIIYCPTSSGASPEQPDLVRVEAARKALARGRSLGGYLQGAEQGETGSAVRNPMLALMDAYLVLKDMKEEEKEQATKAIDAAAATLGEDFPDVIALRYALAIYPATGLETEIPRQQMPLAQAALMGPPMLANSWRYLLASSRTCERLSELMPIDFMPETSGTWFTWSERGGVQHGGHAGRGVSHLRDAHGSEALNLAAKGLVALMQTDAVKGWVDELAKLAAKRKSDADAGKMDPMLRRLIDGLRAIQNPLLQEAFGQQELARRVLLSFNLPSERLKDLLDLLNSTLDKNGLLRGAVMRSVVSLSDYLLERIRSLTTRV